MILTLSKVWLDKAIAVGKERQANAVENDYQRYGTEAENLEIYHVHGAVSEAGVAKHYNLRWDIQRRTVGGIDVGGLIEVRSRPMSNPWRDLPLRPRDRELGKAHLPFVLVWVHPDYSMELKGWLYGWEGMDKPACWNGPSKCWYNPPPYRPIEELEALCRSTA